MHLFQIPTLIFSMSVQTFDNKCNSYEFPLLEEEITEGWKTNLYLQHQEDRMGI